MINELTVGLEITTVDEALYAAELSRPNVKYFLYYPIIVAAAAIMLWSSPTDAMTAVSCTIATAISCLMMWEFLFTNQVIRFSCVCAMGLLIGYGAGTLNSWLTIPRGSWPLAAFIGQTVPELANGVAAALMGCAVLLCVGELVEKPILTMAQRFSVTSGVRWMVFFNCLLVAAAVAAGKFIQGGLRNAGTHKVGALDIFLEFILGPTVVLATIIFLTETGQTKRYLFGGIALFLWLLEVTQGRRDLVYPAIVTVALARYAGYRWGHLSWKRIILVVIGVAFMFVGVLTYQLLRLAGGVTSDHTISAESQQVQKWAREGRAWNIATRSSISNVAQRTLIVYFLSDILYRTKTEAAAYGQDLLLQTELTVPSIIYKNKPTMVEEGLASQVFGVQYPDLANSLFTAGAIDFGVWGVMVYPILTILLISLVIRIGVTYFSFEVSLFGIALFLEVAIAAEQPLAGYFGSIRNLITFALFLYTISRLPRFQWN